MEDPKISNLSATAAAVATATVPMSEIAGFFDRVYSLVAQTIAAQGAEIVGPAFAYYRSAPTDTADIAAGFPISTPIADDGDVVAFELPAGPAAVAVHQGAYDQLGDTWGALMAWAMESGFTPSGPMWEVYVTEPTPDMNPDDLITQLVLPGTPPSEQ